MGVEGGQVVGLEEDGQEDLLHVSVVEGAPGDQQADPPLREGEATALLAHRHVREAIGLQA